MSAHIDIILTTINARYSHSAFGLRCLRANLGALRVRSEIVEFDIKVDVEYVAEQLLAQSPRIIGISVYIWNSEPLRRLLHLLSQAKHKPIIVLGGPEVSWLPAGHSLIEYADYVLCGEGETAFAQLCSSILERGECPDLRRIACQPENLKQIKLPYEEYTESDIASRIIYAETTRGCPFSCAYCLSALDHGVRYFPLDRLFPQFENLIQRGVRRFKFLDRSFNINDDHALRVLRFFRRHMMEGMQLHFELIPDRLSDAMKKEIGRFEPRALHFEVGMQTYDPFVAKRINRRCDFGVAEENIRWLSQGSGAEVHVDLIAGLPGEDLDRFGRGFNQLYACGPHEIQVGILKRLHGAPIDLLTDEWGMCYASRPPYEVISTSVMDSNVLERIKRFARFWEVVYNRGDYAGFMRLLLGERLDPFETFMAFSEWLYTRYARTHAIPMLDMLQAMFDYLKENTSVAVSAIARVLLDDYLAEGRRTKPPRFLTDFAQNNVLNGSAIADGRGL